MDKLEAVVKQLVEGDNKRRLLEVFGEESVWSPAPWHREAQPKPSAPSGPADR